MHQIEQQIEQQLKNIKSLDIDENRKELETLINSKSDFVYYYANMARIRGKVVDFEASFIVLQQVWLFSTWIEIILLVYFEKEEEWLVTECEEFTKVSKIVSEIPLKESSSTISYGDLVQNLFFEPIK